MELGTFVSHIFFLGLLQTIRTKCISRQETRNYKNVQTKISFLHCSDESNVTTRILNRATLDKNWNPPTFDIPWDTNEKDKTSDTSDSEDFFEKPDTDVTLDTIEEIESIEPFKNIFQKQKKTFKINGYQFLNAINIMDEKDDEKDAISHLIRDKKRPPKEDSFCSDKPIYIYVPVESTGLIDILEWKDKQNETTGGGKLGQTLNNDNDSSLCPEKLAEPNKSDDLSFCGDDETTKKPSTNVTDKPGKDESSDDNSLCGDEPNDDILTTKTPENNETTTNATPTVKKEQKNKNEIKDLADLLPPNSLEDELLDINDMQEPKKPKNKLNDTGDTLDLETLDSVIFNSNESVENKNNKDKIKDDEDLIFIDTVIRSIDSTDLSITTPITNNTLVENSDHYSIESLLNSDMNEKLGDTNDVLTQNSLEAELTETPDEETAGLPNGVEETTTQVPLGTDKTKAIADNNSTETSTGLNSCQSALKSMPDIYDDNADCDLSLSSKEASLSDNSEKSSSDIGNDISSITKDSSERPKPSNSGSLIDISIPFGSPKISSNSTTTKSPKIKKDKYGNEIDVVSDASLDNSKWTSAESFEPKFIKKYTINKNGDIVDPVTGDIAVISNWDSVESGKPRRKYMLDADGNIIQIDPDLNVDSDWQSAESIDNKNRKRFRVDKNNNLIEIIDIDIDEPPTISAESSQIGGGALTAKRPKISAESSQNSGEVPNAEPPKISASKRPKIKKDKYGNEIDVVSDASLDSSKWTSAESVEPKPIKKYTINKNGDIVDPITGDIAVISNWNSVESGKPRRKYMLDADGNIIQIDPDLNVDSDWQSAESTGHKNRKRFRVDKNNNLIEIIDIDSEKPPKISAESSQIGGGAPTANPPKISASKRPKIKKDKYGNEIDVVSDASLDSSKWTSAESVEPKPIKKYTINKNGDIVDPITGDIAVISNWNSVESGKPRRKYMLDADGNIIQIDPDLNVDSDWQSVESIDHKNRKRFRVDKNNNLIEIIDIDSEKPPKISAESSQIGGGAPTAKRPKISDESNEMSGEVPTAAPPKISTESSKISVTDVPTRKPKIYGDKFGHAIEVTPDESDELSIWTSAHSLLKRPIRKYRINKNGDFVDVITGEIEPSQWDDADSQQPKSKYKLDKHGNIINIFPDDIDGNSSWMDNEDHGKRFKKTFKVDKHGNLIDIIDSEKLTKPPPDSSNRSSNETFDGNDEVTKKNKKFKGLISNKVDELWLDPNKIIINHPKDDYDYNTIEDYDLNKYPDVSKYFVKVDIVAKYPEMFMDTGCDKVETEPATEKQSDSDSDYDIYNYGNLFVRTSSEESKKPEAPAEMFEDTVC